MSAGRNCGIYIVGTQVQNIQWFKAEGLMTFNDLQEYLIDEDVQEQRSSKRSRAARRPEWVVEDELLADDWSEDTGGQRGKSRRKRVNIDWDDADYQRRRKLDRRSRRRSNGYDDFD
ncbi:MAG: hypothetical protein Kow00106_22850 [Anaerolineae bacterium]